MGPRPSFKSEMAFIRIHMSFVVVHGTFFFSGAFADFALLTSHEATCELY